MYSWYKKKEIIRGEIEAGPGEGRGEQKAVRRRDSKNQNDKDWSRERMICLWPDVGDASAHGDMCGHSCCTVRISQSEPYDKFQRLETWALLSSPSDFFPISIHQNSKPFCPSQSFHHVTFAILPAWTFILYLKMNESTRWRLRLNTSIFLFQKYY